MAAIHLPASAPSKGSSVVVATSVAVHITVALLIVAQSGMKTSRRLAKLPHDIVVFAQPRMPSPPAEGRPTRVDYPSVPRLPTVARLDEVVGRLPARVVDEFRFLDPSSVTAELARGGAASRGALVPAASGGSETPAGAAVPSRLVDKPVVPRLGNPEPRYPDALRATGVEGAVLARFVVDSTGRVSPSSVEVLRADHDLFAGAVRAVLPRMRFAPAEWGGRRVAAIVEQPFVFRLER